VTQLDKQTVRELAKRYTEITCSEAQEAMNRRMRDTNDLKSGLLQSFGAARFFTGGAFRFHGKRTP